MRSAAGIQAPCGMRATGPVNPAARKRRPDAVAMHDGRLRARQDTRAASARLRNPAPLPASAPAVSQSCSAVGTAVEFHLAQIGVPIAALDGDVGDQVMQVGFVHHHHAGMFQRHLVAEIVIGIVADLVERDVEPSGIEAGRAWRKRLLRQPAFQFFEQRGGVIGDPAFRGGQG